MTSPCEGCAHVIRWTSPDGVAHASCLRGQPMAQGCQWRSPATESLMNQQGRA